MFTSRANKNASGTTESSNSEKNVNSSSDGNVKEESSRDSPQQWGYDLYPERRGQKYSPSFTSIAFRGEGREEIDKIKCERKVYSCLQNSHLVKLMLSALKSAGCDVDMRRHISCEVCDKSVSGGYDSELNQVVVCQNVARTEGLVQGVLTHEFIHMFDYCRAKLDFQNIAHLACTEIRAANLAHCSFLSVWTQGNASPFNISKRHAECVKAKAVASVMAVRKVTKEEASAVVDSVFQKCYNDMEPIGRRIRRGTRDVERAYYERYHYGYGD